jgi:hypothetical protein
MSGQAGVISAINQLRKSFPAKIDAAYLKRFQIAPANESYVIAILRFVGLIDEEGNRVEENTAYFYGNDDAFKSGFESAVRSAYSQLFDEMGDAALTAKKSDLTHWFRAADKTTELVGSRQTTIFQALLALAGHGVVPAKATSSATPKKVAAPRASKATEPKPQSEVPKARQGGGQARVQASDVGLTVRIEVNLPPGGDADTYDAIFASIKKHLMS